MPKNFTNYVVMICFGDNDFHSTFRAVLLALRSWLEYTEEWEKYKDKEKLIDLINRLSPIAYDHVQSTCSMLNYDYLRVDSSHILVGNEVDEYLSQNADNGNSEWFILDMRIPNPDQQVFSF